MTDYQLKLKQLIKDSDRYEVFHLGDFTFNLSDYYKYRDPYCNDGFVIYLYRDRDIKERVVHLTTIIRDMLPIFWFNVDKQKFTPFYQSRRRGYGGLQDNFSLSSYYSVFGIENFKHYKKIQKEYLEDINNLMLEKCYPFKHSLEKELEIKTVKEKVRKI